MENTMKRAHEIKKEAAKKWNCEISEIVFSICLKMAHAEKGETKVDVFKTAKGHDIEITVSLVEGRIPVRICNCKDTLLDLLSFTEKNLNSGKIAKDSARGRLALGRVAAINARLEQIK